ncbi:TPA: hypothetical protein MFX38_26260 [Klebsiella pneumoniae]|nr:hypothetical protein F8D07_27740 [Klebsiella pneumoniae]NAU16868.1 hypothetical protein [Klebsiella pneumoniae]OVW59779.1 hypothetical protein BME34_22420 [Klebsiella pneumoniae]HBW9846938.1 hypothetical protein [Klebsiella pneumoniae]HBX0701967.1 hypothetical protein [Klebsiella pneumoniae]
MESLPTSRYHHPQPLRLDKEVRSGYRIPRARKGEASIVSPNRLQRQFNPDAPDERWVTPQ